MSTEKQTAAVVGACGGAGATRLTVETAATLAADGRSVGVVDVAFATQGLADHVPGEISPDVTAVLTDEASLDAALVELPFTTDGRVAACPARAPFERFARAETAAAAGSLGDILPAAADRFDHVLVDAPPVATNQAVAAVTAADRVAVVAPATDRGANAVARVRGRLRDVGASEGLVVANRADGDHPLELAEVDVPTSSITGAGNAPAVTVPERPFAEAIVDLSERLFETSLDRSFEDEGLLDRVA